MRRRHNVAHHIQGIVVGLELVAATSGTNTTISLYPGLAIDGFGREILVMRAWPLDPAQFGAFVPQPPATLSTVGIYVAYDWGAAQQPSPGFELCDDPSQYQVVQETFMLVPSATEPLDDPIMVDGKEAVTKAKAGTSPPSPPVPNDLSVPYQELPEDGDAKNRFVLVGRIQIDSLGSFTKTVDLSGRKYVGIVAKTVYAPSDTLTLMKRDFDETKDKYPDPFAIVDGATELKADLTADADVYLPGVRSSTAGNPTINFQAKGSAGDLLSVSREQGPPDTLRVNLGKGAPPKGLRFAVGPPGPANDAIVVDDKPSISVPSLELKFGTKDGAGIGQIGVNEDRLYFRAKNEFDWVATSPTATPLMKLQKTGRLTVGEDLDVEGHQLFLNGEVNHRSWVVTTVGQALGFDHSKEVLIPQGWTLAFLDASGTEVATASLVGSTLKLTGDVELAGAIISDQQLLVDVITFTHFLPASWPLQATWSGSIGTTKLKNAMVADAMVAPQSFDWNLFTGLSVSVGATASVDSSGNVSVNLTWSSPRNFTCSGVAIVR
jgi:hypothetical protein